MLRVPYTVVTPEDWGGVGGYPLGQWIADQRRTYVAGTLEAGRVAELEKLGMVWSEQDAAWADGIAVAKQCAAVHGHFFPPTTATWDGHPIGVWAKNARAAARRARENEELRAAGRPVPSAAGAMAQARQDELDAIDPGWCPAWDIAWQRCYRLVHNHVQAGGTLPTVDGDVVVQGEDLGRWVNAQRFGWEQLLAAQQWLLENTLKFAPAEDHERPVKQTQEGEGLSLVGADEGAFGEQCLRRLVAAQPVADQVDVGAGVAGADQEGPGHADDVRGVGRDDPVDDGEQVLADCCLVQEAGGLVQCGDGLAAGVVGDDVLAGHAGDDASHGEGVEVAFGPVGEDPERFGYDAVLPVRPAEQHPVAAGVRVVLDVPEEVRAGVDIADDFEDHPGAVQEVVAVTDGCQRCAQRRTLRGWGSGRYRLSWFAHTAQVPS
ncbi:helicase associated domain-containing protein [Streptomyces sp. NPDC057747]|uniref:helicase associated domain-containing protein n=1 Tax=Streptomyces sp. NPDC057747 TaxID=3346238 RepID=UPI0036A9D427